MMSCPRNQQGFTLIEVLVAITLLGMIVAMLSGGIRLAAHTWETGAENSEAIQQIELSHQVIRRLLSQAYPLVDPDEIPDFTGASRPADISEIPNGRPIEFQGGRESMTFAGLMPSHLGGGFHQFELRVDNDGGGGGGGDASLVLRWRRLSDDDDEIGETILIEQIAAASFTYFGPIEGATATEWQPVWDKRSVLPALVRLAVVFLPGDRRSWPDLVVAPRIDAVAAGIE
jgi:general secretion pathway protein J